MSWVEIDDRFTEHPKIALVGGWGGWLQLQAISYCNRNLTDGFVPAGIVRMITTHGETFTAADGTTWRLGAANGHFGRDMGEVDWVALMVAAGLWEEAEGGIKIHDFEDYQYTREEVEARRKELAVIRAEAGRKGGLHTAERRKAIREAKQTQANGAANGQANAEQNSSPTPTPTPTTREKREPSSSSPSATTASEHGFEEWWTLYPRKVGKGAALKSWRLLTAKDRESFLAMAAPFSEAWRGAGSERMRFCPHPATFINQRRYTDDPAEWKRQAGGDAPVALPRSTAPAFPPSAKALEKAELDEEAERQRRNRAAELKAKERADAMERLRAEALEKRFGGKS